MSQDQNSTVMESGLPIMDLSLAPSIQAQNPIIDPQQVQQLIIVMTQLVNVLQVLQQKQQQM